MDYQRDSVWDVFKILGLVGFIYGLLFLSTVMALAYWLS